MAIALDAHTCGRHNQTRLYRKRSPHKLSHTSIAEGRAKLNETIQAVIRSVKLD